MAAWPLIAVVGPTASGKTALAIELAKMFDGEIICADSRTVYKGLDIGTAKPTLAERRAIKHHLLDVVEPDEKFTVADFKKLATEAVRKITDQQRLPILTGGSGLYVDSFLFDYQFSRIDSERNPQNPRHLAEHVPQRKSKLRENTCIIGLQVPRDDLRHRISSRVEQMVASGLVEEVDRLKRKYSHSKALDAPGYKAIANYLEGHISLDEAKALFIRNDMNLAKRQITWFKRNKSIHWVNNREEAVEIATTFLNKLPD